MYVRRSLWITYLKGWERSMGIKVSLFRLVGKLRHKLIAYNCLVFFSLSEHEAVCCCHGIDQTSGHREAKPSCHESWLLCKSGTGHCWDSERLVWLSVSHHTGESQTMERFSHQFSSLQGSIYRIITSSAFMLSLISKAMMHKENSKTKSD